VSPIEAKQDSNMRYRIPSALAATLLCFAVPVFAHHSTAMFDHSKEVTVQGTVKSWQWTNPHSWLQLMARDEKGAVVEQGFEVGSPNTLFRNGWRANTFKAGDKVTIVAYPRRDRSVGGLLVAAQRPDGTWLTWLPKAARNSGK
jgi:hypothetical protein